MSATVSPAELAERTRRHQVRCDERLAVTFLEEWRALGVTEEVSPGRWALTRSGSAMFGGWADWNEGADRAA